VTTNLKLFDVEVQATSGWKTALGRKKSGRSGTVVRERPLENTVGSTALTEANAVAKNVQKKLPGK